MPGHVGNDHLIRQDHGSRNGHVDEYLQVLVVMRSDLLRSEADDEDQQQFNGNETVETKKYEMKK
jgi:hypothetical protein